MEDQKAAAGGAKVVLDGGLVGLTPLGRTVPVDPGTHRLVVSHEGYEYGYVLKGTLEIVVGAETFTLQAGESMGFDSMIPHVLRNVGELMWRGSQTLRSGTIEVCVLPPVDTREWRRETVADHVAEVRGMFLETLEHWPAEPDRRPQEVAR